MLYLDADKIWEGGSQQMGILSFLFGSPAPTGDAPRKQLHASYNTCTDIPVDYTVIDLETSGLDACSCEILEIGAVKVRNNIEISRYHTYVRPVGAISKEASEVNGLTWKTLRDQPFLEDVQQAFFDFIGDDILVGHNIGFDIKFIQTRCEVILENQCFDTLKWSRLAFPTLRNYKLDTLRTFFSLSGAAHSALGDCITTHQLLQCIANSDVKDKILLNKIVSSTPEQRSSLKVSYNDSGYEHWFAGEEARRAGDFDMALTLFQLAESEGYNCPAIYTSYVMIYRKRKDYAQEIAVAERALQHLTGMDRRWFQERKERAQYLLTAQRNREEELLRKTQAREEKAERRRQEQERKASMPKHSTKKPVIQVTDNQEIVREFESISAAAKECGVSSKSIRDAISGRQKHAGGYRWMYAPSLDPSAPGSTEPQAKKNETEPLL